MQSSEALASMQVAEEGAEKVPTDADLQALFILLARACGLGSELREKAAQAHLHLLEDDPFCCSAVAGETPYSAAAYDQAKQEQEAWHIASTQGSVF